MRFKLNFTLEKNIFPSDYRRIILSYTKKALSELRDGKYYERFFKDNIQKNFCYTVRFWNPKFKGEEILLEKNEINVIFTSSDKDNIGLLLQQSFLKQRDIKFKIPNENSITLTNIKPIQIKEITNNSAIFKVYDLVIREHNKGGEKKKDIYYTFDDNKFSKQFQEVIYQQGVKAGFSHEISSSIKFTPIKCKKVLVRHYGTFIDTTVGSIMLQGDARFINHLFSVGMGSRTSCFGFLDYVTEDL